jgi:hypothetical protein
MNTRLSSFSDYATLLTCLDAGTAAHQALPEVFRRNFDPPGFHLLVLPAGTSSHGVRRFMVDLKQALSDRYEREYGESLEYLSLGRFDQQCTTKLHLDGAPELAFLMLGYEPTRVSSQLHIADYSRCADELGLTPLKFLEQHNPMFSSGQEILESHTVTIADWPEHQPRILLVNNSHTAQRQPRSSPGVLHGATIPTPNLAATRIINSIMIAPARYANAGTAAAEAVFLNTDEISGPINLGRYTGADEQSRM